MPAPAHALRIALMWTWTLNWNEIRSDLVVGSCPLAASDLNTIRDETDATAILSLQTDDCRSAFGIDLKELTGRAAAIDLLFVNTPMLDFNPPDQRRNLPAAVRALTHLLAADHKVYVHCTAGLNRSPLTVLGYLAFVETLPPDDVVALIRESRPAADPSWEAFYGCRQDLVDCLKQHIVMRAYFLSKENPDGDADRHWYQAETDVIRQMFTSPRSLPRTRLDPSRP
jgi:predicted protein tyrosine phosphatase